MSFLELGKLRKMYELGNPMSTQFKVSLFWQKLLSLFFRLRVKIHLPLFLKMLLHLFHRHKEKGPLVALLLGNWFLLTFFFLSAYFYFTIVQNYYTFISYFVLLFRETERNYILASPALGVRSPQDLRKFYGAVINHEQKQQQKRWY